MTETACRIDQLMAAIVKIPGPKMLTLMTTEHQEPLVIDVSSSGVFGYRRNHCLLFRTRLAIAFANAGSLIIRQILPIKIQREMPNGGRLWIPRKQLYGVSIAGGDWMPLSREEMRWAHCIDCETGRPIAPEKDVSFGDFPAGVRPSFKPSKSNCCS